MSVSVEPGDEKNSHLGGCKNFFFSPYNKYTVTSTNVYSLAHLVRKKHLGLNLNPGKHTLIWSYYVFKYNCDFRMGKIFLC